MKAIVLHEYGPASLLTYEDVEDPKPAEGEVLVRVSATSINPADWLVRSGAVKDIIPVEFPYILGCDLAGTVLEVGEGVTSIEPGDRVMAMALHTYAELCTVKATNLVKIPAGLEMNTAAALPLVNITGDTADPAWCQRPTRSDRPHHRGFRFRRSLSGLRGIADRCSGHCWRSWQAT